MSLTLATDFTAKYSDLHYFVFTVCSNVNVKNTFSGSGLALLMLLPYMKGKMCEPSMQIEDMT